MKLYLCFLALAIAGFPANAQQKKIGIGDMMPDVELKKLINYSVATAKMSDFKGKMVILDFWATWCSPCISALPKLTELQGKYKGQIEILPVTREEESKVKTLFKKLNALKGTLQHSVVEDKVLGSLFDFVEIPHYVWIDKSGKVIAITESEQVTDENIGKALSGNLGSLPVKKEVTARVLTNLGKRPVFLTSNMVRRDSVAKIEPTPRSSVMVSSVLTRYVDGLISASSVSEDSTLITFSNQSINRLYRKTLWRHGFEMINDSKILFEVDSSLRELITGSSGKTPENAKLWKLDNLYCYELQLPHSLAAKRWDIVLADLNRYFGATLGIEGLMEKRKQKYLALVKTTTENKFESKGGTESLEQNKVWLKAVNVPMDWFLTQLRQPLQLYPYFENETGFNGKLDIELNCNIGKLEDLNKELEKYGLKFVEKEKLAEIAVVRMKK